MSLIVYSVNHHRADLALREQVAFSADQLFHWIDQLKPSHWQDLVLLSTCNRTELYAEVKHFEQEQALLQLWAQACHIAPSDMERLSSCLDIHRDQAAMVHLIRVASGLDSQLIGEPQILGQLKQAVAIFDQQQLLSARFKRYFDYAFFAAKKVRTETAVGEHAISLGYAVTQHALQVFGTIEPLTALIVATGEMNSLVTKHLVEHGIKQVILCNRTYQRAQDLAAQLPDHVKVEIIGYDSLDLALTRADIICSCSGRAEFTIHLQDMIQAQQKRHQIDHSQPQLMIDLAVPRDIDPQIDQLSQIYLYDIDALQRVIEENLAQRRQAAADAEVMVGVLAEQFVSQQKIQQAGTSIEHYRHHADKFRAQEMQHALQQLKQGMDAETVLEQLSKRLTNKLLHVPSRLLREAATAEDPRHYIWLQETIHHIHRGVRPQPTAALYPEQVMGDHATMNEIYYSHVDAVRSSHLQHEMSDSTSDELPSNRFNPLHSH